MSSPFSAIGEELLAGRAAHRARHRLDDHVVEARAGRRCGCRRRGAPGRSAEALVVDVERVRVLHDELAPAQEPGPRARLVAVLGLDLVERQRQVLVRRVQVLDQQREHLLVRRAEQVVGALAVLEPEDVVAVVGPAAGRLVGLARQQRREVHLLGADRVHLLADDPLDVAQHLVARAAATSRCPAPRGGCSRRAPAAGGWAPRRRPGRRAACGGTGSTSAACRDPIQQHGPPGRLSAQPRTADRCRPSLSAPSSSAAAVTSSTAARSDGRNASGVDGSCSARGGVEHPHPWITGDVRRDHRRQVGHVADAEATGPGLGQLEPRGDARGRCRGWTSPAGR